MSKAGGRFPNNAPPQYSGGVTRAEALIIKKCAPNLTLACPSRSSKILMAERIGSKTPLPNFSLPPSQLRHPLSNTAETPHLITPLNIPHPSDICKQRALSLRRAPAAVPIRNVERCPARFDALPGSSAASFTSPRHRRPQDRHWGGMGADKGKPFRLALAAGARQDAARRSSPQGTIHDLPLTRRICRPLGPGPAAPTHLTHTERTIAL